MRGLVLVAILLVAGLSGCAGPTHSSQEAVTPAPDPKPFTRWVPIAADAGYNGLSIGADDTSCGPAGEAGASGTTDPMPRTSEFLLDNDTLQVLFNLTIEGLASGSAFEAGWRVDGGAINWTGPYEDGHHSIPVPFDGAKPERDGPRWDFFYRWKGTDPTKCGGAQSFHLDVLVSALQRWDGVLPPEADWDLLYQGYVGLGRIPEAPECAIMTGFSGYAHPIPRAFHYIGADRRIVVNITLEGAWTGFQFGHRLDDGPMEWSATFQSGHHKLEIPVKAGQEETRSTRWDFAWRPVIDPVTSNDCPGGGPPGGGDALLQVVSVK